MDLPEPVPPITPIVSPGAAEKLTCESAGAAPSAYEKVTSSKTTAGSSRAASSVPSRMELCVSKTWLMRAAQAADLDSWTMRLASLTPSTRIWAL